MKVEILPDFAYATDVPRWSDYIVGFELGQTAFLVEIEGIRLVLYRNWWFRYEFLNKMEWTYFFYDTVGQNVSQFNEAWLEKQFQEKRYGRVVPLPVSPAPDCGEFELLYFRADGTGYVWPDSHRQTEFRWDTYGEVDPINEEFEVMSYLGRLVFDDVNGKLKNPRIDPASLTVQPLEFINGSQEELERVTRWICHSGLGKPTFKDRWEIVYSAPDSESNRVGGVESWQTYKSPVLRDLFALAYEYNSFTGYHWEHSDEALGFKGGYDLWPASISIHLPSATPDQEQEARLQLLHWLEGKETPEEIQRIFGSTNPLQGRKQR